MSEQVQRTMMVEERCILVDADDIPTGETVTKAEAHRVGGPCASVPHRAFSVFLFNEDDELLVQRRAPSKLLFPGHWANTCCSHPLADASVFLGERIRGEEDGVEGVKRAAVRKLKHELGVHLSTRDLCFVTRVHYKAAYDETWGEHEMDYVLMGRLPQDAPVRPDAGEVDAIQWLPQDRCKTFLETQQVSPWFGSIATWLLLPHWWPTLAAKTAYAASAVKASQGRSFDDLRDARRIHKL